MAGRASDKRSGSGDGGSAEVHESIEFKAPATGNANANANANGGDDDMDADGDADPDVDADGDVEMPDAGSRAGSGPAPSGSGGSDEAAKQAQAAAARAKRDLLHLIETTAHYLSSYEEDGVEICSGFQRIPNKRLLPDYFDVIKEPTAFSTIRGRVQKRFYTQFSQFVRDAALICHNAQVYNRPSAPIFQDAVKLREVLRKKLQALVEEGAISAKEAELPYLGEIPDFSPSPPPADGEGEEDGEEEEEDDDDNDSDDNDNDSDVDSETGRRRTRRGGRAGPKNAKAKLNSGAMATKMYTANEARVNAVLAGLRELEDEDGDPLLDPFEQLPDREQLPDYYEEIKHPMAVDMIKMRSRRKLYSTADEALADFELMFNNAKAYNQDGSPIYKAAVKLQGVARRLMARERAKPDETFRDAHGRLAVPAVQHLGQVWRAGDWILLRNANDANKPIVGQIFRMWVDVATGVPWVNACWYYRPEQTVHRFDRHFWPNEVIKTEQYRDHAFVDVLDRTFVMFAPQYARGQPRGYPPNKTLYVCAYRYSEDRFRFTKITKWDALMPEEVRGLEILMDVFAAPRPMAKYASPIKHLLHDDARETDALPKPTWGNPNAPPIVGAVHRRPRLANESPPPETSAVAPQPPITTTDLLFDPSRRVPMPMPMPGAPQGYMQPQPQLQPGQVPPIPGQMPPLHHHHPGSHSPAAPYAQQQFIPRPRGPVGGPVGVPSNAHHHLAPSPGVLPSVLPAHSHSPSPVPVPVPAPTPAPPPHMMPHQQQFSSLPPATQQRQPSLHQQHSLPPHGTTIMPGYTPSPQPLHAQPQFVPSPAAATAAIPAAQQHRAAMPNTTTPAAAARQTPIAPPLPPPVPNGYVPPRATAEAYVLPPAIDSTIPPALRKHYHRDAQGRVLFFTAPSIGHAASETPSQKGTENGVRVAAEYAGLGHSARYLNGLDAFREERRRKRKARDEAAAADEAQAAAARAAQIEADTQKLCATAGEALGGFVQWMNMGTRQILGEGEGGGGDDEKPAASTLVAGQS